jgi:hypothetical protein
LLNRDIIALHENRNCLYNKGSTKISSVFGYKIEDKSYNSINYFLTILLFTIYKSHYVSKQKENHIKFIFLMIMKYKLEHIFNTNSFSDLLLPFSWNQLDVLWYFDSLCLEFYIYLVNYILVVFSWNFHLYKEFYWFLLQSWLNFQILICSSLYFIIIKKINSKFSDGDYYISYFHVNSYCINGK